MTFALTPYLPSSFDFVAFVALVLISLLLIFVGSRLTEGLAFAAVALVAGSIGYGVGSPFGVLGSIFGFVGGFLLGGAAAVFVLPAGMGLVLGFMGFQIAAVTTATPFVPLVAGVLCFTYGLFLTDLLLPVVCSVTGGMILYDSALALGISPPETLLVVSTLSTIGVIVQTVPFRRANGAIRRRQTLVKTRTR